MAILSDFNIICLNQEKPEFIEDNTIQYEVCNLNTDEIYHLISNHPPLYPQWDIFKSFKGIWYYIFPSTWREDTYTTSQDFFNYNFKNMDYSNIVNALKSRHDGMKWSKNRKEDIKKIIDFYLEKSPIKRIFIMCRIGIDKEAIVGTMTKREFFSKMNRGELRFNVAYIVKDN